MLASSRLPGPRTVATAIGILLLTGGTVVLMDRHGIPAQSAYAGVDVVVARDIAEPGPLGQVVGDPVFAAVRKRTPPCRPRCW